MAWSKLFSEIGDLFRARKAISSAAELAVDTEKATSKIARATTSGISEIPLVTKKIPFFSTTTGKIIKTGAAVGIGSAAIAAGLAGGSYLLGKGATTLGSGISSIRGGLGSDKPYVGPNDTIIVPGSGSGGGFLNPSTGEVTWLEKPIGLGGDIASDGMIGGSSIGGFNLGSLIWIAVIAGGGYLVYRTFFKKKKSEVHTTTKVVMPSPRYKLRRA